MTRLRLTLANAFRRTTDAAREHLRARYAAALLVLAPILFFAVYQVRLGQTIHVGVLTDDKPYVTGMLDPEQADFGQFRWTGDESTIRLPGQGGGPYRLTLRMAGSANPRPAVEVRVNGTTLATLNLTPGLADYTIDIPAAATTSGDLVLTLKSNTFQPPNDRRELGVVLNRAAVSPTGDAGLLLPPETTTWQLFLLVLLAYLLAAVVGFGPLGAGIVGGATALGAAALLLVNRPWLTVWVWTGGLTQAALTGCIVALLLLVALPFLYRLAGLTPAARELRWPILLATLLFIAHFGGDLHPHTRVVDLQFHVNRYRDVNLEGRLLLWVQSREWGTRETIYPPTAYLFMRALRPLAYDIVQTVLLFMALLEAFRLCLVYLIARRATGDVRAAIFAAAVFGIVPMAYLPYSWGIATNVFGAWWTTALFALLALAYERLRRPAVAALAVIVATLGLLSHPGEFVLLAATLVTAAVIYGLAVRPRFRGAWPALILVAAVAGVVAFGLLYRFVAADMLAKGGETIRQKLGGGAAPAGTPAGWRVGGAIDDPIIGLKGYRVTTVPALIRGGLVGYWREAVGYYYLWPPLFALAGLWLMRGGKGLARLRLASVIWWLVAALFAIAGLLLNVYVRYAYYLLPVVAVGAGLTLARLTRTGRAGQALVALLLAATTAAGLWFWYLRISVDGH